MQVSNLRLLVLTLLCVGCFLWGRGCRPECPQGGVTVFHQVDTVFVKDTVKVAVVSVKGHAGHAVPQQVKQDLSTDSAYDWTSTYEDSTVSVAVTQSILGLIVDSTRFKIHLKVPYSITVHDSVVERFYVPAERRFSLYGSVGVYGIGAKIGICMSGTLVAGRYAGMYGYDPFNKTHFVGAQVRLFGR